MLTKSKSKMSAEIQAYIDQAIKTLASRYKLVEGFHKWSKPVD